MKALRSITQKIRIYKIRNGFAPNFCQIESEKLKITKNKVVIEGKVKGKRKIVKSPQETQDLQFFEKIEKIRGKEEFQGM